MNVNEDYKLEVAIRQERCATCGLLRASHDDRFPGLNVGRGHGGITSPSGKVICPKYTWDGKSGPYATS